MEPADPKQIHTGLILELKVIGSDKEFISIICGKKKLYQSQYCR